jgi:N-acetylglutamate synthase-like GNAT family acetyltransferase
MYSIRKAEKADRDAIDSILEEMDLFHGSISIDNFWMGENGGNVVAVAQLENLGGAEIISCVGVKPPHRRNGVASELICKMLDGADGDVYLFTLIPEFFERMGFERAIPPRAVSDYRSNFKCAGCEPERCVCMVRRPHDS